MTGSIIQSMICSAIGAITALTLYTIDPPPITACESATGVLFINDKPLVVDNRVIIITTKTNLKRCKGE